MTPGQKDNVLRKVTGISQQYRTWLELLSWSSLGLLRYLLDTEEEPIAGEIAEASGCGTSEIQDDLDELEAAGFLHFEGNTAIVSAQPLTSEDIEELLQ